MEKETKSHAQSHSPISGDTTERFIVGRVGSIALAINIYETTEIVAEFTTTPLPQVPEYIDGVLSHRGLMIPVLNLRARLGLATQTKTDLERVLILKEPHELVGIMLDEVNEIVRIEKDLVLDLPKFISEIDVSHHFFTGVSIYKDELLFVMDLKEVIQRDTHEKAA
jgi:purine-binding chemotaxis protein CheW